MAKLIATSTKMIRVIGSVREFNSVAELLESGKTSPFEQKMLGVDFFPWWKKCTVAFPDKGNYSSAMVEVTGKTVSVGNPSHFIEKDFSTLVDALCAAESINNNWLTSDLSADQFVNDIDL